MALTHVFKIGDRLKTELSTLLDEIAGEATTDTLSRSSQKPYISLRKRVSGRGRTKDIQRIEEGITIVPLKPVQAGGTNERDDVGYRFIIAIAYGTNNDQVEDEWPVGTWEQAIRQRFQHRRIGSLGLAASWEIRCFVEPGELPDDQRIENELDATALMLTCFVRESRRVPS